MRFPTPVRKISGITLDTTIAEVQNLMPEKHAPLEDYNTCNINFDMLPKNAFSGVRLGDIFYLDEPVSALTSRAYLNNTNPKFTISHLFLLKNGTFYPTTQEIVIRK